MPELRECTFRIACDVTNPLCGPQGCSAIYGPQKGADAEMIAEMDTWMEAYGALTEAKYPGMTAKRRAAGQREALALPSMPSLAESWSRESRSSWRKRGWMIM